MVSGKIKAFIFDMDGTVIDSTQADFLAWQTMLAEHHISFNYSQFLDILGAKGPDIAKQYMHCNDAEVEAFLKKREQRFRDYIDKEGIEPIPGIEDLLKAIKSNEILTALATGSAAEKLDFIFERIPLRHYFDVIITADQVTKGKPDPEIFMMAAEQLHVPCKNAVVVEDAQNGIWAAHKGNMRCIAIATTHPKERLVEADLLINRYADLDLMKLLESSNG